MRAITFLSAILFGAGMTPAAILTTTAHLSGPAENPPNSSPGTGLTIVTYDSSTHMLRVQATFSGLTTGTTASHIHAPATPPSGNAGVATQTPTFIGFPLGVRSGTYDRTLDLTLASSFNASYITANGGTVAGAETALVTAIANGRAYLNIHTTMFPGGEIRGFLAVDSDADGVPDATDPFPNSRDLGGNILIGACDTGVENVLFSDGSTISDLIYEIGGGAKNHGAFVSGVAKLNQTLINQPPATANNFDLARDFSTNSNPNGVWSYGWQTNISAAFNLLTHTRTGFADNGVPYQIWEFGAGGGPPIFIFFPFTNTLTGVSGGGQGQYPPGSVVFYAGNDGTPQNFATFRFTAPSNGNYRIGVSVRPHLDGSLQSDTDFHVVRNGTELFGQFLSPTATASYTNTLALLSGDRIEFAVGRGADRILYGSGLKIGATITPTVRDGAITAEQAEAIQRCAGKTKEL